MQVTVLAGGVGGSKFVRGVRQAYPDSEVSVIVNTADDITLHGLRICPDLDTMMYALGGAIDPQRGWGRAEESWRVRDELAAYGVEPSWFGLGDLDLATHLVRTQMMNAGYPLSEITRALCTRWLDDDRVRLLPMSDDRVETHVVIDDGPSDDSDQDQPGHDQPDRDQPGRDHGRRAVHFQEYWVRLRAVPDALAVTQVGVERATPGPGVLEALERAELILIAPSNPVVSVGPILAVPGIRDAVRAASAPVIGFSPILDGAPVLGMAHRLLPAIGVQVDAAAVGLHYGARPDGILDAWLLHKTDQDGLARLEAAGLRAAATDLLMGDPEQTADFIRMGREVARS